MKSFAAFLPHIVTRWVRECFVEVSAERFRTVANTTSTSPERRRNSNTAREGLQTTSYYILEKSICFRYGIGASMGSSRGDMICNWLFFVYHFCGTGVTLGNYEDKLSPWTDNRCFGTPFLSSYDMRWPIDVKIHWFSANSDHVLVLCRYMMEIGGGMSLWFSTCSYCFPITKVRKELSQDYHFISEDRRFKLHLK